MSVKWNKQWGYASGDRFTTVEILCRIGWICVVVYRKIKRVVKNKSQKVSVFLPTEKPKSRKAEKVQNVFIFWSESTEKRENPKEFLEFDLQKVLILHTKKESVLYSVSASGVAELAISI